MKRILGLGAVVCLALSPLAAETALAHKSGYYKNRKASGTIALPSPRSTGTWFGPAAVTPTPSRT